MYEAAEEYAVRAFQRGVCIRSSNHAREHLGPLLANRRDEVFAVLYLDSKHKLLEYTEPFSGSISSNMISPRVLVRRAIELNTAAAIIAHNHPSGSTTPSQADLDLTERVKEVFDLIEVKLLDRVIVGADTLSLADEGKI